MNKEIIEKSFDLDYPEDVNNPFVGSMYDIYEKGFKRAIGHNDKKIGELSESEIEQLSATWALKVGRPITPYKSFLRETKRGQRNIDLLPYFIIKHINNLGYDVS
jgi:hypothetical protein